MRSNRRTTPDQAARLNRKYFSEKLVQPFMPTAHKFLLTSQFAYDAQASLFTAIASDLGWPPGYFPTSIILQSDKTGVMKTFLQVYREDSDGQHVDYVCKDCPAMKMRIFND